MLRWMLRRASVSRRGRHDRARRGERQWAAHVAINHLKQQTASRQISPATKSQPEKTHTDIDGTMQFARRHWLGLLFGWQRQELPIGER